MGRTHWPRALTTAAVAVVVCVLLIGPVVVFGALTVRASLLDLERRSDEERSRVAALAAVVVSGSMTGRAEQLLLFGKRDDVADAFVRRDGARLAELLGPVVSGRPDLATGGAMDPGGAMIARIPPDPTALGQSFADRDYFAGALRTEGVFVSEAVTSRIDPSLVLVVVAAAVRREGRVVGLTFLTVRPGVLATDLAAALGAPGREIVLVDDRGATIASTSGRPPLGRLGLPGAIGTGVATVEGQTRAIVSAAIAGTAWRLHVLDDPAYIYAARTVLARQLLGPIAAAILVLGVFAALLAAAYLTLMRQRERLAAANAGLREANTQIEAATRAKSEFLASMSHELRTPLNAVLGFSDVLREQLRGTLTERQARYLANIHAAGEHLLELINDVLDLSKVEAGRLALRPEPVALTALFESVVATAAHLASERGVRFEVGDIPEGTAIVDPARLRQVVLNLVSNAVKFTPAGGLVTLAVAVAGTTLRFDVVDTGIGIPDDKRDRVFGMFERLHEGRSDASGTGLGLAITRKLVELHHGTIDFESREGAGSRFWVVLEDVMAELAVGERVLVVEDDAGDAELLAQLARESGLRVEITPTAASAMAAILRSLPTAVILDLRLPDRRGDDVLRWLKASPPRSGIPVLVVTVEDDDGQARLLGAMDHMTKPIDRERLRTWLAGVRTGGGDLARTGG